MTVDWFSATKSPYRLQHHCICKVFIWCSAPLSQCTMEKNSVLIILSGERLLNHYFLSLIKILIISSFSLRATILHGHPLLHAVSWKLEFQRPQSSDLSRAHVSHHVRLHVLVHMSMLQCRKSVCLCVVYVYACRTVLCLPWASSCGERAKVTCKNTFWGQRSKVVSNVYTLRSASLLCQIKTCLSMCVSYLSDLLFQNWFGW